MLDALSSLAFVSRCISLFFNMSAFFLPAVCRFSITAALIASVGGAAHGQAVVSTVAGSGTAGNADGPASTAQFNRPSGVALDAQGNAYVADQLNNTIRKITPAGVVSVFAGNGTPGYLDFPIGTTAAFYMPENLIMDNQGNLLVADTGNGSIRQISPAGEVTTLAGSGQDGYVDGPANSARFSDPAGLAQNGLGNVYVADASNYRIRRIDLTGNVTTLAGSGVRGFLDGPAATARFYEPHGMGLDAAGNLYIADATNNRIRKLTPAGVVSTYAGVATAGYLDGPAATARFNDPIGVAVDASGDVYVMERGNQRLRRIEASTGLVSTVAGSGALGYQDGPALSAKFASPRGITIHAGSIYVADLSNQRIRRVAGLPLGSRNAGASGRGLQLELYPNPAAGPVTIRYYLPQAGPAKLTVYDALGRTVAAPAMAGTQAAGWHEAHLPVGMLPPGSYAARLQTSGQSIARHLVVFQ